VRNIIYGTAFGLCGFPHGCGWSGDTISEAEQGAIAEVAEAFRHRFDAPGLSVAIAREGHFVYQQAFGVVAHGTDAQLTTSHLFRIASISKPITSAAIFTLVEKGLLRLTDTVFGERGILGTQYGRQPYGNGIEQITVDHLLTHTAGGWDPSHDPMFSDPTMSQSGLISWALDSLPLKNSPGTAFAYSNFGYCLLGRVIEKISGKPYAEYVQSAVLAPSDISDMRIAGNTQLERAPQEVFYYGQGSGPYDDPYKINVRRMDSHGGWIATPSDLVNFALRVDGFGARRNILKPETIRTMATPTAANPNYAHGWAVNAKGHWWHAGDLGGTTSILVRTSTRFCWAAIINTRREQPERSADALDDMVWEMVSKVKAWRP
jgi:CubicO group peptidase (beta-lactamase class C family)